jgi:ubiquitin-conjugating enzyme E2 Q
MSLNEIINAPTLFASSKPYLVVQHIDWIQCRYLLVQTAAGIVGASSSQLASVETSSLDR